MAQIDISLTYPDPKQAELIAAMKHRYGDTLTNAELIQKLKEYVRDHVKDIYKEHQQHLLLQARKRAIAVDELDVIES
jgi:pyruvate/oxaloacetate carboxyltransferase